MSKTLLKNGQVIRGTGEKSFFADVLIEGKKIARIAPKISAKGAEEIDVSGKILCPGFIDLEAHICQKGRDVETAIERGTRAAVKGGFTSICVMADTDPVLDSEAMITLIRILGETKGFAHLIPSACATQGLKGELLSEMATLIAAGAGLIFDAGKTISNANVLRRVMEYSKMFEAPLFLHCEDAELAYGGLMHEGFTSAKLGLMGVPSVAEEIILARDILLAEYTGVPIHIANVTTAGSVRLIRESKQKGLPITCATTAHHLDLIDEDLKNFNTHFKIRPPLRSKEDRNALLQAVADGTIDAIVTDHTPCSAHGKEMEFAEAPFGIIGLETAFASLYERLCVKEKIPLERVIQTLTQGPAKILKKSMGLLEEGREADITFLNLHQKETISPETIVSKELNTPYLGHTFTGGVSDTMVSGQWRYKEKKVLGAIKD
jgi:dihydroorotase